MSPSPVDDEQLALESFRSLAADLRFAAKSSDRPLKSVAVTSAGRAEGKTFTASNLALIRAATGTRTLLIDADMRASGVARFFNLGTESPGLSDVLAGRCQFQPVLRPIQVNGAGRLWIVPAGTPTPESAALLESTDMQRLLEQAATRFDLVVVDTPPLNVITDAATVAAAVDGVMLVVRAGRTGREALEMTLERLRRADGHILGVVFNGIELPEQYTTKYEYVDATFS